MKHYLYGILSYFRHNITNAIAEGTDTRSFYYDMHRTVTNAVERAGFPAVKVLSFLVIRRSWYYAQLSFSPLLDSRFNPYAIRSNDEWIVVGFKKSIPGCRSGRSPTR